MEYDGTWMAVNDRIVGYYMTSYEGVFDDTYYLGEPYYATGEWYIENLTISNLEYMMSYKITDIYGNSYWTPVIKD
ncbi:MAG: hypothetical protein SCJ93_00830 [Bacillota bacterium]|nr:hypothetical protein [Bacillota bacterium]